jgi:hypothetical protein
VLVATRSFTDPTDGQPVRAGTTYVDESAEVALRFPERFRPASGWHPGAHFSRARTHKVAGLTRSYSPSWWLD